MNPLEMLELPVVLLGSSKDGQTMSQDGSKGDDVRVADWRHCW